MFNCIHFSIFHFKDIRYDMTKQPTFCADDIKHLKKGAVEVKKLNFVIDNKIQNIVNKQKEKFKIWIKDLSVGHMIFNKFGKNECKKFGVSPDAIMQLAFQLAIFYQINCVVPTYESCSTAAFKHGRTETLRSCTMETKKACEAMARKNGNLSKSEVKNLIINCSKLHNILSKEAVMGDYETSNIILINITRKMTI